MGVLSQRKHLVLRLLSRTCGTYSRDVIHERLEAWLEKAELALLPKTGIALTQELQKCVLVREVLTCF